LLAQLGAAHLVPTRTARYPEQDGHANADQHPADGVPRQSAIRHTSIFESSPVTLIPGAVTGINASIPT
jgi:hypothetical protein